MPETARLFSVRATLALGLMLAVPFLIRSLTNLQPFPALLFPAGANELSIVDGKARFSYIVVYAQAPSGLLRIETSPLLLPMPPQYFYDVAFAEFGQSQKTTQEVKLKRVASFQVRRPVPSAAQRKQVLDWLSQRVREQSTDATHLVLRFQTGEFDLQQGRLTSSRVEQETVVPLS